MGVKVDSSALEYFGNPGRTETGETLVTFVLGNNIFQMTSSFHDRPAEDGHEKVEIVVNYYFVHSSKQIRYINSP